MDQWIPPRSLAARTEWAKAHPWIAATYFGLFFAPFLTVFLWFEHRSTIKFAVIFGLVTWPVMTVLFAVGLKRHWGERPGTESHGSPSLRRP